jgi:tetratricopeptide (TPR) repeat protein
MLRGIFEAEALFSQGKLDDALRNYQKALELDPKIYEAALFSGDVLVNKEDFRKPKSGIRKRLRLTQTERPPIAIRRHH